MRYLWKDKLTEIEVEVERRLKDSQLVPDKKEAIEAGMDILDYPDAIWIKIIQPTPTHRSGAWGTKGNMG